ncbi:Protein kinase domain-containing protein [Chitinophaga eiseniae]|uniref:non-specific serine/threonine protein kinase n=1 Tax=Chitinophaga eiseniae TaxID=634771 RepID=A0A1T4U3F7_9BACT|nr:protein kinase [Chitinophaga eiseniae]SKA47048.1 Protein kinase domain-containing protein [Chitinophaga eiseniae]
MINELKETHNQNVDQQNGFHHLLDEMGILYTDEEVYLNVGGLPSANGWALFLTSDVLQVRDLIKVVSPLLYNEGIAFSVIKNKTLATRKNDFWHGPDEVGKMIIVFTVEEDITRKMIARLAVLTKDFWGPGVNYSVRVAEIIYVTYIKYFDQQQDDGSVERITSLVFPNARRLPFKICRKYQYWKRKRLLKRRYVPLQMISRSPKGDLLKSVDLRGLKFNWCFIKEGKYHVFNDKYGRYIKDRLKWQAKVLCELEDHIPIPKFIDYFEQGEECYLVMEFLDGVDLFRRIDDMYQKRKWSELDEETQQLLIRYYLDVLFIIEKMHQKGYIHRDATASNFMVLTSGEVYTIDLELSYSIYRNEPFPPFAMGVFGYASPEQIALGIPTIKEDVYTMGALLLHVLTGKHPNSFISNESEVDAKAIVEEVKELFLQEVILSCIDLSPDKRPELKDVRAAVESMVK